LNGVSGPRLVSRRGNKICHEFHEFARICLKKDRYLLKWWRGPVERRAAPPAPGNILTRSVLRRTAEVAPAIDETKKQVPGYRWREIDVGVCAGGARRYGNAFIRLTNQPVQSVIMEQQPARSERRW
jgi:hypothetical protein